MDWVILAGTVGPEAPWTRGTPRALMPLPGTSLIETHLSSFRKTHGGTFTICANGHTDPILGRVAMLEAFGPEVGFVEDKLPLGTAGCLKACQPRLGNAPILVVGGAVWFEDDPEWLIEQHRKQGNTLTVFGRAADPLDQAMGLRFEPSGIYCCEPDVLRFVHSDSYQDIKEQLVPRVKEAGLRVGFVKLERPAVQVLDWSSYLAVLDRMLSSGKFPNERFKQITGDIWCGEDVHIAPSARIVGPALLGHGCRLDDDVVVIGPSMLDDGCHVGAGTWLVRSVVAARVTLTAHVSFTDEMVLRSGLRSKGTSRLGH